MVNKTFAWTTLTFTVLIALSACSSGQSVAQDTLSPEAVKGKQVFTQYCAACHDAANDLVVVGPSLVGLATRAGDREPGKDARAYIEESILTPDAYTVEGFDNLMPKTFEKTLSEEEFNSLIAFLLTLK